MYYVFGIVNKGSEYEKLCRFTAFWDNNIKKFTDKDGEDLNNINENIKYWFNINNIANPIYIDIT